MLGRKSTLVKMNTLKRLGVNALSFKAKELGIKPINCTEKIIPWSEIIAPYEQTNVRYERDLYLWSWQEGLIAKLATDAKLQYKADFALYKINFLIYGELKNIPHLSHIAIYEEKTVFEENDIEKSGKSFKIYRFMKNDFKKHSANRK